MNIFLYDCCTTHELTAPLNQVYTKDCVVGMLHIQSTCGSAVRLGRFLKVLLLNNYSWLHAMQYFFLPLSFGFSVHSNLPNDDKFIFKFEVYAFLF